ncbi:MAG: hypothetical protein M1812_001280 [Candelaria pacifica]|nr:MAG: hypothetical protein M1812_001280 [Candelaria pacifica]
MSASPAASSDEQQQKNLEQISFRFCRECSNMLYPKEDKENRTLMFACRTCQFSEPAASSCVFRNNLQNSVGETHGVTQDVGSDPTVGLPDDPDNCTCTFCGKAFLCFLCGQDIGWEFAEDGTLVSRDESRGDVYEDDPDEGDTEMSS